MSSPIKEIILQNQSHPYYRENLGQLLADNEPFLNAMKQVAKGHFPQDERLLPMLQDAWNLFVRWVPGLPYIGGKENFLTGNLVFGAMILCVYLELRKLAYTNEQIGLLVYETQVAVSPPAPVSPPSKEEIAQIITRRRDTAERSQIHPYAYDWQTTFIEGDQVSFDWGVDYHTCGICRLYQDNGAADFTCYCCFLDLPSYTSRGIGLVRTKTLAGGAEKCDFRFNLRGEYRMDWHPGFYKK
jgi:hypothetical protein